MTTSAVWSPSSAPPTDPNLLRLPRQRGRLRGRRHLVLAVPAALAGWGWLGPEGLVLAMLWWWHRRPEHCRAAEWRIDLGDVRAVRLGRWRVRVLLRGGEALEIFADEVSAGDLARLRRSLIAG
jgi:hypothetical protein